MNGDALGSSPGLSQLRLQKSLEQYYKIPILHKKNRSVVMQHKIGGHDVLKFVKLK